MIPLLILLYFFDAFLYASLCGLVGKSYHPLASYQVYAIGASISLIVYLAVGRATKIWNWRRLWPPTMVETQAALSSLVILTCSTLGLLYQASLITVIAMKAGRLLLVKRPNWILIGLAFVAVGLSAAGKPLKTAVVPLLLAAGYVAGYAWKLRAVRGSVIGETANYLAAEQVIVQVAMLATGLIFSQAVVSAPLTDLRLWGIAATSLGAGLFGTAIMLLADRRGTTAATFPAYSMASLIAALGASFARGEHLGVSGWLAIALASIVVLASTVGPWLRQTLIGVSLWLRVRSGSPALAIS